MEVEKSRLAPKGPTVLETTVLIRFGADTIQLLLWQPYRADCGGPKIDVELIAIAIVTLLPYTAHLT